MKRRKFLQFSNELFEIKVMFPKRIKNYVKEKCFDRVSDFNSVALMPTPSQAKPIENEITQ